MVCFLIVGRIGSICSFYCIFTGLMYHAFNKRHVLVLNGPLLQSNVKCWFCLVKAETLTHLSLASLLWDIGKQNSPRCDATERGVPSGAILFA